MGSAWRVELLGGLRVTHGERVITPFRRQKVEAIFAYLAFYGHQSHPRDALIELLWPEIDPDVGRNNLRVLLHRLREQLDEPGSPADTLLLTDRDTVRLRPTLFSTDAAEFIAALEQAGAAPDPAERVRLLAEAMALYAGELLPGAFEPWVLTERQHLAEVYLGALHQLVEALEQSGDLERALPVARRAVATDPLREEAHYDLMRLYAAAGQPSATLRQYQELERLLREELGETPSAATRALAEELRQSARTIIVARSTPAALTPDRRLAADPGADRSAPPPTGSGLAQDRPASAADRSSRPFPPEHRELRTPPGLTEHDRAEAGAAAEPIGRADRSAPARGPAPVAGRCAAENAPPPPASRPPAGVRRRTPLPVGGHPSAVGTLPMQFARFFGREEEIARLEELLCSSVTRLVTLTGPGGSGKTRLGIAVASRIELAFEGAVAFVPLADLTDARQIPGAIADALGLARAAEVEPLTQVIDALRSRPWLLVLDNFEHLAGGRPSGEIAPGEGPGGPLLVRSLLERVPTLTCLVTSRQPLGITGEQEFVLLPLPTPRRSDPLDRLTTYASVQLFLDRARAVRADFRLTEGNAAAVAELCDRLEGLPLALELAAARAGVLTPQQMLQRLTGAGSPAAGRFELLVSQRWDVSIRHRSLRAAIASSYQLLSPELQPFFARLSVFRGGWTLEAAEAVCEAAGTLESLQQLQQCSLIYAEEAGAPVGAAMRYRLLEALREFAAEQLSPEERSALEQRHAEYFLALAEEAEPALREPERGPRLDRLEQEHDNLRAALDWSLAATAQERARCELGLRLATALAPFWFTRGFIREGRERLTAALAWMACWPETPAPDTIPALPRVDMDLDLWARALAGAGSLALAQSDFGTARAFYEQRLALCERRDDPRGVLEALLALATVAGCEGSLAVARSFYERGLALSQQLGDQAQMAQSLSGLGGVAELEGDYPRASSFFERSVPLAREVGARSCLVWALHAWGFVTWQQGDVNAGRALLEESLAMFREMGHRYGLARTLERLAGLALALRQAERAARLYGAATSLREAIGSPLGPLGQAELDRDVAAIRDLLGEPVFTQAWGEGGALTLEQAIDYALAREAPSDR
jgi:predicted ATPase/DNA-binding SARP family transcriptional activator